MGPSLILPAYVPDSDLLGLTVRCLESLRETVVIDHQLVVVDNGSTAEAQAVLEDAADIYIQKPEPIGYARAANIGLAIADGEWLVVLNTDLTFEPRWLTCLLKDYVRTPGGVLSCVETDETRKDLIADEAWFSCWLTHRDVIRAVGYFDEAMGFRFHDQDFAIRVHRAGFRVMRSARARVSHIDSATYDRMGRDDDPEEEALLVERWGARGFVEWMNNGQCVPGKTGA